MSYLFVILGFVILIYGADFLVNGASAIAKNFKIPNIVIGLTIVAFGTSAPELVINVISSMKGNSDLVISNVIGSNIFNATVILGICAMMKPIQVIRNTHWLEIPFNILAAFVVLVIAADIYFSQGTSNVMSISDGIIMLLFFAIFVVYNLQLAITGKEKEILEISKMKNNKAVLFFVLGLIGLVVGGHFIVDGATTIAKSFGISDRIIGLTVLAIGTSLPELASSVAAMRKGNTDIAIGNVVGSNIFNIFYILGLSVVINPVQINPNS
jgi:cation:H+ antiporter